MACALPDPLSQYLQGTDADGAACQIWFQQPASIPTAVGKASSASLKPPAGTASSRGRGAKAANTGRPEQEVAGAATSRLSLLCRLLTAWKLISYMPSLCR